MRRLLLGFLILCFCAGGCRAKVSVSPVIIETAAVKAGDVFHISCRQEGEHTAEVRLSLALFDQNQEGQVFFLEDEQSVRRASEILNIGLDAFRLEQGHQRTVQVKVLRDDFKSLYAVLFVTVDHPEIPTRLAVLFLLSAEGGQEEVALASWRQDRRTLELTVVNEGRSHGFWRGELLCFDSAGRAAQKLPLQSGIVLPSRSRNMRVGLPDWVQRVEVLCSQQRRSR